ncbi:hypothetical protein XETH111194_17385 [Xenorhabdus thuongxuanensis]
MAFGLEGFHHLLKGEILMGIGRQRPFPNLGEQVSNSNGLIQGDAQGQGIDEETD